MLTPKKGVKRPAACEDGIAKKKNEVAGEKGEKEKKEEDRPRPVMLEENTSVRDFSGKKPLWDRQVYYIGDNYQAQIARMSFGGKRSSHTYESLVFSRMPPPVKPGEEDRPRPKPFRFTLPVRVLNSLSNALRALMKESGVEEKPIQTGE